MRGAPGSSSSSAASERGCCCRARTGSPAERCGLRPPEVGTHRCRGGYGGTGSRRGRGAPGRGAERSGGVCGAGAAGGPARQRAPLPAVSFGVRVPPRSRGHCGCPRPRNTSAAPAARTPPRLRCSALPHRLHPKCGKLQGEGELCVLSTSGRAAAGCTPPELVGKRANACLYLPLVCCEHRAVLASGIICWESVGRGGGRRGCRGLLCGGLWFVQVLGSSVCEG